MISACQIGNLLWCKVRNQAWKKRSETKHALWCDFDDFDESGSINNGIKIKALLWIFGTPRVFRYLPFLLGECCCYQQLWTHYQCGTRWSHLPNSGFGTTLRRTTSRCERCFCPDESWPASQAAFAAFASVCTASDLIQAGDLVTGGDVVGVVKENGPFGVRVLWWFLRTPSWAINVQRQMSYLERVQFPTVVLAGCVNLRCWGWCITHARRKTGMGPVSGPQWS